MDITAEMVRSLRETTGAGMMECKKALVECEGDLAKAIDLLRVKGKAGAEKRAARAAAEGVAVAAAVGTRTAVLELNCETDFVARNDEFRATAQALATSAAALGTDDVEALLSAPLADGRTGRQALDELLTRLKENMALRRCVVVEGGDGAVVASYVHTVTGKIAVVVKLAGDPANPDHQAAARNIAMHIAASKPVYVKRDEVPADVVEHERAVLADLTRGEGKPEAAIPKIVEGRLGKFFERVCLVDQPYVREPSKTVGVMLKEIGASATSFTMLSVGQE